MPYFICVHIQLLGYALEKGIPISYSVTPNLSYGSGFSSSSVWPGKTEVDISINL